MDLSIVSKAAQGICSYDPMSKFSEINSKIWSMLNRKDPMHVGISLGVRSSKPCVLLKWTISKMLLIKAY